jgi:hypothetical protein
MAKRKKRKVKPALFIYCEGKTEEYYFKSIKEALESKEEDSFAFDIRVVETDKSEAVGLIKEAQREMVDYGPEDQFWAVFDKDGYTKHQEAFEQADKRGKKVNIAFSSISFEHWVLLHFKKNKTPFVKSECKDPKDPKKYVGCGKKNNTHPANCKGKRCVTGYLRQNNFYQDYEKAKNTIYFALRDRTDKALENSSWLRMLQTPQINATKPIYQINPYTDVDLLVSTILGKREVTWCDLGKPFSVNNIEFCINEVCYENKGYKIKIAAKNEATTRKIINNSFIDSFYLSGKKQIKLKIEKALSMEEGESGEFILVSTQVPQSPDINLIYEDEQKKIIFVLEVYEIKL